MMCFDPGDVVLVTGGSSGIGKSTALLLNECGATVVAVGRDKERLELVRKEAACPDRFHPEVKDLVEDIYGLDSWVSALKNTHGKLKGLINCAGILQQTPMRLQDLSTLQHLFAINFFVPYMLTKAFLDRRNNVGEQASVVFIASTGAIFDNAGISGYAASKGAIVALSRSLACEFASRKIRINVISPADVQTPLLLGSRLYREDAEQRIASYPLGIGKPEDVAGLAVFLLSNKARWITGQNYILDGGVGLQ